MWWGKHAYPQCLLSDTVHIRTRTLTLWPPATRLLPYHSILCPSTQPKKKPHAPLVSDHHNHHHQSLSTTSTTNSTTSTTMPYHVQPHCSPLPYHTATTWYRGWLTTLYLVNLCVGAVQPLNLVHMVHKWHRSHPTRGGPMH